MFQFCFVFCACFCTSDLSFWEVLLVARCLSFCFLVLSCFGKLGWGLSSVVFWFFFYIFLWDSLDL